METQIFDIPNTSEKAKNHVNGSLNTLYSYNKRVARYDSKTDKVTVFGYYSTTTGRHINEFFKMFGKPTQTKKELFKNFNLKR